jgi:hypothetical protein
VGKLLCLIGCSGLVPPPPGIVPIAVLEIGVSVRQLDHLAEPDCGENVRELFYGQRRLHVLIIYNDLDALGGLKTAHLGVGQSVEPLRVPPPPIGRVGAHVAVGVKHAVVICGHSHIQVVDALRERIHGDLQTQLGIVLCVGNIIHRESTAGDGRGVQLLCVPPQVVVPLAVVTTRKEAVNAQKRQPEALLVG